MAIPPIEGRKKRRRNLATIPPYLNMEFPSDVTPPPIINYGGFLYDNPVLVATTVKSGKSNSSDWRTNPNVNRPSSWWNLANNPNKRSTVQDFEKNNNIYRYTIVSTSNSRNLVGWGSVDTGKQNK